LSLLAGLTLGLLPRPVFLAVHDGEEPEGAPEVLRVEPLLETGATDAQESLARRFLAALAGASAFA